MQIKSTFKTVLVFGLLVVCMSGWAKTQYSKTFTINNQSDMNVVVVPVYYNLDLTTKGMDDTLIYLVPFGEQKQISFDIAAKPARLQLVIGVTAKEDRGKVVSVITTYPIREDDAVMRKFKRIDMPGSYVCEVTGQEIVVSMADNKK